MLPFLVVGVVALVGLVVWTLKARDPVVPPSLLRVPGLASANLVTLVMYAALGAHLLFLPVYLQFLGFSPTLAGPRLRAAEHRVDPARAAVRPLRRSQRPSAADRRRRSDDRRCRAAAASRHDRADAWTWGVASVCLFALGLSAVVAPITAAALSPAPEDLAGVAAGLNQTVARVGGILSVAAIGALAGAIFVDHGGVGDTPFDPSAGARCGSGRRRVPRRHPLGRRAGVPRLRAGGDRPLRGHRQSRTPSSVSSATLRSSPPP